MKYLYLTGAFALLFSLSSCKQEQVVKGPTLTTLSEEMDEALKSKDLSLKVPKKFEISDEEFKFAEKNLAFSKKEITELQ